MREICVSLDRLPRSWREIRASLDRLPRSNSSAQITWFTILRLNTAKLSSVWRFNIISGSFFFSYYISEVIWGLAELLDTCGWVKLDIRNFDVGRSDCLNNLPCLILDLNFDPAICLISFAVEFKDGIFALEMYVEAFFPRVVFSDRASCVLLVFSGKSSISAGKPTTLVLFQFTFNIKLQYF